MTVKSNIAEGINRTCSCKTLNTDLLSKQLNKYEDIFNSRPNLFSSTMTFISEKQVQEIRKIIATIEKVIENPVYQTAAFKNAPSISQHSFGTRGVFMGYDFHINEDGPKLIEINTNAGGALLNAELARAQHDCCVEAIFDEKIEEKFFAMFVNEWNLQKPGQDLKTIAIIDETPEEQYLYPEFRLFEKLFTKYGLKAFIADPNELEWKENKLWLKGHPVDLIYNRMTDFYLEEEKSSKIRYAFENQSVVLTPNPYHHALFANKLNLCLLSDEAALDKFNLSAEEKNVLLKGIPKTEWLNPELADSFWGRRKDLFFKPASGFGSKASYRGDKITKRVWDEILTGNYVAQKIIPPGCRLVSVDGKDTDLKMDVRAYSYVGQVQIVAARLYAGQTTNFRTSGGGFAPVFITP